MYIPLDERPCNYNYPQNMTSEWSNIAILVPPKEILGDKKKPADNDALWLWLEDNIEKCSYMVASVDMIMYGGIVPSRLHSLDTRKCEESLARLESLKERNSSLKIYAFNLIMRVPSYNSSDEEPEYYNEYGEKIFMYSWLCDKVDRGHAENHEIARLEAVKKEIPSDVLNDYTNRRKVNSYVNNRVVKMAEDGVIEFLVLPLDDCAEYGFSANEQHKILRYVEKHNIHDRVYMYPGADEVGCTLIVRVANSINKRIPCVYTRFSSTLGPYIIPVCEDRVLGESIKSQIIVCGGIPVDNSIDADLILMVNSPAVGAGIMNDARQGYKDVSYYSMRNLREFVAAIRYYIEKGKKCALADVALVNGAESELMSMLSGAGLLGKLYAYAGWNTSGNTLGTVISHAMARLYMKDGDGEKSYVERLVEDWGYQADVRQIIRERIDEKGLSMESDYEAIRQFAVGELNKFIVENINDYKEKYYVNDVYFPWKRLFEIGFTLAGRERGVWNMTE